MTFFLKMTSLFMTRARDPPHLPSGHVCSTCGRRYKHRDSLVAHEKKHTGATTCHVCGSVASNVQNLRQHLESVHKLGREHVRQMTQLPGGHRTRPAADPAHRWRV